MYKLIQLIYEVFIRLRLGNKLKGTTRFILFQWLLAIIFDLIYKITQVPLGAINYFFYMTSQTGYSIGTTIFVGYLLCLEYIRKEYILIHILILLCLETTKADYYTVTKPFFQHKFVIYDSEMCNNNL